MNKGETTHEKKFEKLHWGGGEHRSLNQQASGFAPVLGFKKSKTLKKKTKAFTLAEVLITLAIIGVVAALTIPTVVAKYQKKAYYTQFMKAFNTLSVAKSMAEAENGNILTWHLWGGLSDKDTIKEKMLPYFKIAKVCETYEDCGISNDLTMSYLNYTPKYNPQYPGKEITYYKDMFEIDECRTLFILNDGSIFNIDTSKMGGDFFVRFDTNGTKGPNIYGRDIFLYDYEFQFGSKSGIRQYTLEEAKELCSTEVETVGITCAYRLLLEGKMNY